MSPSTKKKPRHKVLIDASTLTNRVDGLSVYIVSLIKHLPTESEVDFDYTILVNPGIDRPDLKAALNGRGFSQIEARIAPIGPRRDWDMFWFLRRSSAAFDLIHITSNNYPFALRNGVCTIHDVTFKTWFDGQRGIPGTAKMAQLYLSLVIGNCLRNARAIVAVSASTKSEIGRLFGATRAQLDKITVIHEGWEHLAAYQETDCSPFAFEETGYLFFLGSHRVHKNLTGLLRGFFLAMPHIPRDKRLVISGSSGEMAKANREIIDRINAQGERVVFTGYLSNACVRRLYANADAFVFPSLAEGFGLPVLEAFHLGTPLLCARATSLPEVAGEAALYFDPVRPEDIAAAIARIYAEPGLARTLRDAGRERLTQFSWIQTAADTVALYRRCLS